jgi:hypothetical protein
MQHHNVLFPVPSTYLSVVLPHNIKWTLDFDFVSFLASGMVSSCFLAAFPGQLLPQQQKATPKGNSPNLAYLPSQPANNMLRPSSHRSIPSLVTGDRSDSHIHPAVAYVGNQHPPRQHMSAINTHLGSTCRQHMSATHIGSTCRQVSRCPPSSHRSIPSLATGDRFPSSVNVLSRQ